MASSYRKCLVCGSRYRFCKNCSEYETMPMWYNLFHNDNCHEIWYLLSDFESGILSKKEAQEKISHLDTSVITNKEALKSLDKLMGTDHTEQIQNPAQEVDDTVLVVDPYHHAAPQPEEAPVEEDKPLSVSEELKKKESNKGQHMQVKSRVKKNSK